MACTKMDGEGTAYGQAAHIRSEQRGDGGDSVIQLELLNQLLLGAERSIDSKSDRT